MYVSYDTTLDWISRSGGTGDTTEHLERDLRIYVKLQVSFENLDVNTHSFFVGRTRELWMNCSES